MLLQPRIACCPFVTTYTFVFFSLLVYTQCLFSFGHGLHPQMACCQLVTTYTFAFFVLHWLTPNVYSLLVMAYTLALHVVHWSLLIPSHFSFSLAYTQCLFSFGSGLHPRIACCPLVTLYTFAFFVLSIGLHPMLILFWSWLTPSHCLLFIGHCLHSRIASSPLVRAYTHTFLLLWLSVC